MRVEDFVKILGADFYTGVPDSQLKALCDYLMDTFGISREHHIIAANEGNCVGLAAGYNLATGKIPVVYMQNSGEGNIINPVASLLNDKVYAIPVIFVIGWRGEPGVHDEPQHIYQGEVTIKLLEDMGIRSFVIRKETSVQELSEVMTEYKALLASGKDVSFVIAKGALTYDKKIEYKNDHKMSREEIIRHIVKAAGNDMIVSTTGKASRELFEIREQEHMDHGHDFLTVGSMGHSSSIALGIALQSERKVWCIDGDGAALMHMGSLAVTGANKPQNLVHIVINNSAHETVGGMPTVADSIDLTAVAAACGYPCTACVDSADALDTALKEAGGKNSLSFIEVKCAIGARGDLGRPTSTPLENKEAFIRELRKETAR